MVIIKMVVKMVIIKIVIIKVNFFVFPTKDEIFTDFCFVLYVQTKNIIASNP